MPFLENIQYHKPTNDHYPLRGNLHVLNAIFSTRTFPSIIVEFFFLVSVCVRTFLLDSRQQLCTNKYRWFEVCTKKGLTLTHPCRMAHTREFFWFSDFFFVEHCSKSVRAYFFLRYGLTLTQKDNHLTLRKENRRITLVIWTSSTN